MHKKRQKFGSSALHQEDHSIWPAFADILMVISLVFLLVIVTLTGRNSLLGSTLEKTTTDQLATEKSLTAADQRVDQLRLEQHDRERENWQLRIQLARRTAALTATEEELRSLEDELAETTRRFAEEEQAKRTVQRRLAVTRERHGRELQRLRTRHAEQLQAAQAKFTALRAKNSEQAAEFQLLEVKYHDLLRPARSAEGKQVVAVTYHKEREKTHYSIQRPGDGSPKQISYRDLHTELQQLRDKLGQDLYVRVIFPEGTRTTHQEAWEFTHDLLGRYDYYYQAH